MGDMKIKLVVTDLDSTLLRHDKTISAYTADVFRRMRERGILLAFATARDYRFVTEFLMPMNGVEPDVLIAGNGALAQNKDRVLYKRMIPHEIINALKSRFESIICVSTEDFYYFSGDSSSHHWSIGKKSTVLTDCSVSIKNDAYHIEGKARSDPKLLIEGYPDLRIVVYSDSNTATVVHHQASKLNALIAVADALNIDKREIAVFGDDFSDVEMLMYYDYSVAVANAIDECKAAAKYACGSNEEDGVACWIEENVLNRLMK